MNLIITKSARKFGYIIWSKKTDPDMRRILGDIDRITIVFNGLSIGVKMIDWKYHRISIGYKFTRALPQSACVFELKMKNNILEVTASNEK